MNFCLFSSFINAKFSLRPQPIIPDETVQNYKDRIKLVLEDARIGPELRVQDFDKYMPLINGEVTVF